MNADAEDQRLEIHMTGDGHYNKNSSVQAAWGQAGEPELRAAAAEVSTLYGNVISVADFGSSEGANSVSQLHAAVNAIRSTKEGSGKAITITHMDTLGNDWRELFRQTKEHPQSYREAGNVYTYAYAGTFYEQCFPTASLSLAYSSIALHWASRAPVSKVPDALVPRRSAIPEIVEAAKAQAAADWAQILRCRASELRPGGRFVVVSHGIEADERLRRDGYLSDIVYRAWRGMFSDGRITEEELYKPVNAIHLRTVDDFLAPLRNSEFRDVFEVVSTRILRMPCPIHQVYERGGSAGQLAARYAQFRRAFDECTFSDALSNREPAERAALVDEMFKRVEEGILQSKIQEPNYPVHIISLRRLA